MVRPPTACGKQSFRRGNFVDLLQTLRNLGPMRCPSRAASSSAHRLFHLSATRWPAPSWPSVWRSRHHAATHAASWTPVPSTSWRRTAPSCSGGEQVSRMAWPWPAGPASAAPSATSCSTRRIPGLDRVRQNINWCAPLKGMSRTIGAIASVRGGVHWYGRAANVQREKQDTKRSMCTNERLAGRPGRSRRTRPGGGGGATRPQRLSLVDDNGCCGRRLEV